MQGTTELVLSLYGGKEPYCTRSLYFLGETISTPACGCRPGDAGEYRFWNAWGLKVPKTCTPPRPPGNAGDYRTCAVVVWREEPYCTRSLLLRRINQEAGLRVPARGRGGVQVLERLGPESPQNLYSPAPPGQCRGLQNLCCLCMAGRNPTVHVRYFLGETISTRACGCRPGDAGEYRFWNAWGLKVPKTCTPPRPPGPCRGLQNLCCLCMAGRNPTVHVRYFLGETISTRACGCRPGDAGEYRFWNAWGLKVPKTCTPPRPPGNAGDYRTCAVFVWREGTLLYTFVTS